MSYFNFVTEKDVPMPKKSGKGAPPKYPFFKMEVGESLLVPGERVGGKAYNAAIAIGRTSGKRFSGLTTEEGVRIWRTK